MSLFFFPKYLAEICKKYLFFILLRFDLVVVFRLMFLKLFDGIQGYSFYLGKSIHVWFSQFLSLIINSALAVGKKTSFKDNMRGTNE